MPFPLPAAAPKAALLWGGPTIHPAVGSGNGLPEAPWCRRHQLLFLTEVSGPGGLLSPSTPFSWHARPPGGRTGCVLGWVVSGMSLCWEAQGQPAVSSPWFALVAASSLSCRPLTAYRRRVYELGTHTSVFKHLSLTDQHFRVFRCASRS